MNELSHVELTDDNNVFDLDTLVKNGLEYITYFASHFITINTMLFL